MIKDNNKKLNNSMMKIEFEVIEEMHLRELGSIFKWFILCLYS